MKKLIFIPAVFFLLAIFGFAYTSTETEMILNGDESEKEKAAEITHGPVLGRPAPHSMGIWIRTNRPSNFQLKVSLNNTEFTKAEGVTQLSDDNSGWVNVDGLKSDTRYNYAVYINGNKTDATGSFKTLPDARSYRNKKYNPDGLYNFSFEHGSCNFNYKSREKPRMRTYKTMVNEIADRVDFQIMNGDFIYEYKRGMPVEEWSKKVGIKNNDVPTAVDAMPGLVGVWENYKHYYDLSADLRKWHSKVPAFFMFDDHELFNDINGAGTPGFRNRKAVYRDVGIKAWYDYLGWSNPIPDKRKREIVFGKAEIDADNNTLTDPKAEFNSMNPKERPTLHIHWNDDHKNAGVYKIVKIVDNHTLKLSPKPEIDAKNLSYSIGRRNFYKYQISNAEFFVLDTRSNRGLHDKDNPDKEGLTMLGEAQREWLIDSMEKSDADFLFVVSSVSFTIPHVSKQKPNKDESWTSFLDERKKLMQFWDDLDKQVILLTGDLHNGIAIEVSDNIHEYVSGPHSSGNHFAHEEGSRPPNGSFTYNNRTVDIAWSSYFKEGTAGFARNNDFYVVVDVKNVFNNPVEKGKNRWITYPRPHVVIQYYNGKTGELEYAETIHKNIEEN